MSFDNTDAVLAHHGVKGMKWGVRKQRATVSSSPKPKGHDDYNHAHSDIANMTPVSYTHLTLPTILRV